MIMNDHRLLSHYWTQSGPRNAYDIGLRMSLALNCVFVKIPEDCSKVSIVVPFLSFKKIVMPDARVVRST